jgi:hypothetical protein
MVDMGKCSFVQQTRNIERNGGALAIIIDNKNEEIDDITLSDDGTGQGIRIPAMLISKDEGERLKEFLRNADEEQRKKTSLTAEFKVEVRDDNEVNVELWYTASDDKSLDFIRSFKEFVRPILGEINFYPRPVTWSCPHCEQSWKNKNCVSDGLYCAMQHDNNLHIDGKEIIMENLRHFCLNEFAEEEDEEGNQGKNEYEAELAGKMRRVKRRNTYFDYVAKSHELCRNRISKQCSTEVLESMSPADEPQLMQKYID